MGRFDLDVWLRQPTRARDRDMRAKENGEGGVIRLLRGQRRGGRREEAAG